MIKEVSWEVIFKIWRDHLWPNRISSIEPRSVMKLLGGYHNLNHDYHPNFYGFFQNNYLIGVNSFHLCPDNTLRSRGLFVFPENRGQGIGVKLLFHSIEYAKKFKIPVVWSYPRITSWNTYEKAGFKLLTEWKESEAGLINAYCILKL